MPDQPAARLLDCGYCYEEQGEEVHPHPECPIGQAPAAARAALRDRIAEALATAEGWRFADGFKEQSPTWQGFLRQADAVMAVLPPPATTERCVHDRAVHEHYHHQPVDGCPWCAAREQP